MKIEIKAGKYFQSREQGTLISLESISISCFKIIKETT